MSHFDIADINKSTNYLITLPPVPIGYLSQNTRIDYWLFQKISQD